MINMSSNEIFEYESDWVETFNAVLKNEIRDEIDNKNSIKANIVESNQSLNDFIKRNKNMELIPSKEPFFHNIKIKLVTGDIFFYVNNKDTSFCVITNM